LRMTMADGSLHGIEACVVALLNDVGVISRIDEYLDTPKAIPAS
jgi:hypothetical protein